MLSDSQNLTKTFSIKLKELALMDQNKSLFCSFLSHISHPLCLTSRLTSLFLRSHIELKFQNSLKDVPSQNIMMEE
jgi:hypothetical protein